MEIGAIGGASKVPDSLVYLELWCGGDQNHWQGLKFASYRQKAVANLNPASIILYTI